MMAARFQAPQQLTFDMGLGPSLSRDDLVVSPSNRAAIHQIDAWPDWISPITIVVGDSGSGKTHILSAWQTKAVAYACQRERLDEAIEAAQHGVPVAIDDLIIYPSNETELFHLINTVRQTGTSLMATMHRAPNMAAIETPDLASRLRAATSIAIEQPDDDLLRAVFAKLFADRQVSVDPDVVDYCIARMPRSLQAVVDLVAKLDEAALSKKRAFTTRLAGEVLAALPSESDDRHL
ncbi:MAG: DnaA/Hda family protein [Pseudomonadota bacterium]